MGGGPRRIWLYLHEDHYACLLPSLARDCTAGRQLLIDSVAENYNEVMPTTPLGRVLFTGRGGGGKGPRAVTAFSPLRAPGSTLPRAVRSGPGVSSSHGGLTEERLMALGRFLDAPRASRELHGRSSVEGASAGAPGLARSCRIKCKTPSAVLAGSCSSEDAAVARLRGPVPSTVGASLPGPRKRCIRSTVAAGVRPCRGVQAYGGVAAVDSVVAYTPVPQPPVQDDSLLLTMPRRCRRTSLVEHEARVALLRVAAGR